MTHEEIMNTIATWDGTFDKLVRKFEPRDYATMLEDTNFSYVDEEYMSEFYEKGYWDAFLHIYIGDWLMYKINYGEAGYDTDNLLRLWSQEF